MALTRRQFRERVLDSYGLPEELPSWITSRWINTRINRRQREVSELTEIIQGTYTFTAAASTRTYSVGTDFIRIMNVEADSNRRLDPTTQDIIEAEHGDDWRGETGSLSDWYIEDYRHIGLYPIPATAGSALTLYGPRYANNLANDTGASEIPTALEYAVVNGVCADIAAIDPAGKQKLGFFRGEYNADLGKFRQVRPFVVGTEFVGGR